MTHVFIDTNVLLDVLLHREPFVHDSARVLNRGFKGEIALYSTPLSFSTCMFVARKQASGCSHIVTRNERHFPQDGIIVLSPTDFMQLSLE